MSKSERTKQRILEAATHRLYQVGLSGFRIDDLVDDLGLTRQTFYRYFKTKHDLIKDIIVAHGKALSHVVFTTLVEQGLPFREFLAEGVIVSVERVKNDSNLHQLLGNDLQLAIGIMITHFKTMEDELFPIVEPFVLDAQAQGIVKPDVTTRDIMRWVFRAFLSEMLLADLESAEERRQYLMKMLVPAICVDEYTDHP